MNLWVSGHFLVVGLFLSVSALTPEECKPLVTPLSLADPSMMYGRTNFIAGYVDSDAYKSILKITESSWLKLSASPTNANEVIMYEENKMNGMCFGSTVHLTIDGDTATTSISNITSVFHLLPTCEGCLLLSVNSTARDLGKFLGLLNINITINEEEINARSLYLMGKETTLKDSDLEHFKKQASCFGFSGEPDYHYDAKKGFCSEDEVLQIQLK